MDKQNEENRTDYWKSNDRKYCDFCKCWITDNKPSVAFHENGKRHKANVAKRISEISRNSAKSEKEKQKMDQELRKMEEAALRSYAQDISSQADITACSINTVMGSETASTSSGGNIIRPLPSTRPPGIQIDPLLPPGDFDAEHENGPTVSIKKPLPTQEVPDGTLWIEAKSPEGYTYYWNVKTNESIWEPPKEGYMSIEEYNRINQIAVAQQQLKLEKESKTFQEKVTEEVARYNRERLKLFRRPDPEEIEKAIKRETFKTQDHAEGAQEIGEWQPVVKQEVKHVDLELPKVENYIPQVVTNVAPEPPERKFREKKIETLDSSTAGVQCTFKKRKIAGKGNTRQRLDVD